MIQRAGGEPIEHQRAGVSAGDTLVVAAGDVAIFARQGQLVRVLQPGSYPVPAEFAAPDMEVFFVRTQAIEGEKLGGRLPAGLPVSTAFGTFSWIIRDPERAATAFGGSGGAPVGRFVAMKMQKAVQIEGGEAAMKGAPLDATVHAPILAHANAQLEPLGIQALAIAELTFR